MYHFFVEQEQIGEGVIAVTGPDVNHIKNVLRMKPGDRVLISAKAGGDYLCVTKELAQDKILFGILEKSESEMELPARIHLFQGLPKGDKMDLVIQKAIELGASEIVPVKMKRCVVKLDEKKARKKTERWNAVALSAAKQSKRGMIPRVSRVYSFHEAAEMARGLSMVLVPYEAAEGMEYSRQLVKEVKGRESVGIFIGPEGGFEPAEIEELRESGGQILSLGKRILRTETAGMAMLSVLMFELEE